MSETKQQWLFWQGYELGLVGKYLPGNDDDEQIWRGFSHGHIEREKWFQVSKWAGRRKRFRSLLFGLQNEVKKWLGLQHRQFDLKTWQGISVK